ncbi:FAD-dependent oxidoreductase [Chloroflexota bacterium]
MIISKEAHFPKLFEPGRIGTLELGNRIVIAPMNTRLAGEANVPSPRLIEHDRQLALSGAGLVTVECVYDYPLPNKMNLCDDSLIPRFKVLSDTIHEAGTKAAVQISSHRGTNDPTSPVTPSEAPVTKWGIKPKVLSVEDIGVMAERFSNMARRIKEAGFDAISIHGSHGYLISEFLSPFKNKRTDAYGGSIENRARFAVELVKATRAKVGKDFPLIFRLMCEERIEGGFSITDAITVAGILEEAGVDAIDVTSGIHGYSFFYSISPGTIPHGYNIPLAEGIKKAVSIPVMVAGGIMDPYMAEEALQKAQTDFICIARAALADHQFPRKCQKGRTEDIRPCIRCLYCMERTQSDQTIRCAVNPTLGQEEFVVQPTEKSRRIAVVGGGPAGMEAAIVAAQRGHEVTLFEKRKLGGMLAEASAPEFKEDLRKLIGSMSTQIKKAGIKIVDSEATSRIIKDGKFEAVIVAVGGIPCTLDVPGIDRPSVVGAVDVLRGTETGTNVIVVGGGLVGCDVALFLAERGKKITIVEMLDEIAQDMESATKASFLKRLSRQDVEIRTGVCLEQVTDKGVIVCDKQEKKYEIKGDRVVLAIGFTPDNKLLGELQKIPGLEVCAIGDCVEPRRIHDAIHEGFFASYRL